MRRIKPRIATSQSFSNLRTSKTAEMLTKAFPVNRNVSKLVRPLSVGFKKNHSSSKNGETKISYFHKTASEPLKYISVGQLLSQSAAKFPDREAIVSCNENSRLTFVEALDKANRLASALLGLGLSKGDRVAIWAPNFEFWYTSMFAIARAGLICVSMNPAYQLPELDYSLKKVETKAIIAPEVFRKQKHYEMLMALTNADKHYASMNVIVHSKKNLLGAINYQELLNSASESNVSKVEQLQSSISPDDPFNIQFSSGTTGKPKAAVLSHFNMVNNGYDQGIRQGLGQNYRRICLNNPFFHVYGQVIGIMNGTAHGSTVVLPAPHFSPEDSLKAISKEKCDVIYGTPTMFVDLVSKQRELNVDLPEVAFANTGGAICTPKLIRDMETVLKAKKIRSIYGLTETTAGVFQSLEDDDNNLPQEYVGVVCDHLEAKVVDQEGVAVPFGQPGELCIRGYCTMLGYWKDEARTKEVFDAAHWLKTGDQFILYENGRGKVVGRLKEMIIRGGENLFPREIEDFLNTHPNIIETHVIGIPDERLGEEVGAFVRLKDASKPVTREDIKEFCKGKLSHFKIPRYFVVVEEFPRTVSGKVQKFKFFENFKSKLSEVMSN